MREPPSICWLAGCDRPWQAVAGRGKPRSTQRQPAVGGNDVWVVVDMPRDRSYRFERDAMRCDAVFSSSAFAWRFRAKFIAYSRRKRIKKSSVLYSFRRVCQSSSVVFRPARVIATTTTPRQEGTNGSRGRADIAYRNVCFE